MIMAYLIHYNKNHSKKNGQFVSGDGDGDGVRDDHHNYKKNRVVDKWSGDKIRNIRDNQTSKNINKNFKTSRKIRDDLRKAFDSLDDSDLKNYKKVVSKNSKVYEYAEKKALKEFNDKKSKGEKLDELDFEDIFDKYAAELSPSGRDYTVASLLDLGYSKQDANDVADFLSNWGATPFAKISN